MGNISFNPFNLSIKSNNIGSYSEMPLEKDMRRNRLGYRCDDFITNHGDMTHVLFSGCSHTSAVGIDHEKSWAYLLWKDIDNSSGFFNLAEPGNNIPNIVFDIFKYCSQYGNPDKIFINLPNPERYHKQEKDSFIFWHPEKHEDKVGSNVLAFQYYYMLELYCKSNNIKLVSISYDQITNNLFSNFNTFYKTSEDAIAFKAYEYAQRHQNEKDLLVAADNAHPGNAFQYAYYLIIKELDK